MADYFTNFSEEFTELTPDEIAWCKKTLPEYSEEEALDLYGNSFEYDLNEKDGNLWVYSDGTSSVEALADFARKFLKKFRPDKYFKLQWAGDCSKPRLDAYGSGALMVTAKSIKSFHTGDWIDANIRRFEEKRVRSK